MIDQKSRQMLADDWTETEAELAYWDRLMKGEVSEEEEATHRAKTIESIETGLARQRETLARIAGTLADLEAWRRKRLMN